MEKDWIEEYVKYLKVGDIENMLLLKEKHFPPSFFKYRTASSNTLACIKEDWLWMSEVDKLNDTFECSLLLDNNELIKDIFTDEVKVNKMGLSKAELQQIKLSASPFDTYKSILLNRGVKIPYTSEEQFERIRIAWEKDTATMNETVRICSFSTTNESLLMWAHYADNYKGVCIEYDFLDQGEIRAFLQPVYYSNTRASVKTFKEMHSYSNVVASISKSLDWQYEKEWRLTFYTKSQIENKNNRLATPTPKAIYLGPRFELNPRELKDELLQIAKDKGIPIFLMEIHKSQYKLSPMAN